jgi:8-amino-7-oxononanoate synthase
MKDLAALLGQREAEHLYRRRRISDSAQGPVMQLDGREYLSFCSNDYLGLANHPDVIAAFQRSAERWGVGSGAAHLVNGHSAAHHQLEEELADFVGTERALLFSTGYMANLGVIGALLSRGDQLFEDRLNHASLLDGAACSGARMQRYVHGDMDDLKQRLEKVGEKEKLIASDGVFSMDGDIAPVPQLIQAAKQHAAWLVIDDAHGFGVLGEQGRGVLEHFAIEQDKPIMVGTLGKAFGTSGAFIAASENVIEFLIQSARTYVYTTAAPPAIAEATRTSLNLLRTEAWRREKLRGLIERFRTGAEQLGLQLMESITPIQPVIAGAAENALTLSEALQNDGILVPAIRPPTVPEGTARLRVTFSAAHSEQQVDQLLDALARNTDR